MHKRENEYASNVCFNVSIMSTHMKQNLYMIPVLLSDFISVILRTLEVIAAKS